MQKRLESRKDHSKRIRIRKYSSSPSIDTMDEITTAKKKRYAIPGSLYLRSLNPRKYHTLVNLDDEMAKIDTIER